MKKLLALVITFSMLASMVVLPAWATVAETTDLQDPCPCGCGQPLSQVEWIAWDVNNTGKPESGHYYLDGNYSQGKQHTIEEGYRVVLDLRGNTLSTKELHRLFLIYGYLAVIDSVGGGRLVGTPTGSGNGGILMLASGESAFELFAGTIMAPAGANPGKDGGIAVVAKGAIFRMHGGILMNGSSSTNGGALNGREGSLIEILGGQILDCSTTSNGGSIYSVGEVVVKNATIMGGSAGGYGGNFFQGGGSLTIENSYIAHGMAAKSSGTQNGGGNICAYGCVSNITDTTVHNGYANFNGGNLYLGSGTHYLKNVTATAGVAGLSGGNLACAKNTGDITLEDCTFPGDVAMRDGKLTLKGKITIGLLNTGLNLLRADGTTVVTDVSGLSANSEIYVNAGDRFTGSGASLACFKGAGRTVLSETAEGLVGTQAASGTQGGYCPHCGEQVVWHAFDTTEALVKECYLDGDADTDPACTGRHLESGHYYLTQDYTGFSQQYIGIRLGDERVPKDVVIDLAGFDITASRRPFYINPGKDAATDSRFTLLDSQGGSVVTGSGADGQSAGVIYNEGSHLTIYGGKYVYKPVDGRTISGGGVILAGDSFTMHGGILDGSAFNNPEGKGGAIQSFNADKGADKYVTITAGLILGGTANAGGAIHVGLYNHLSITGGLITGGNAVNNAAGEGGQGGNIRTYATSSSNDDGTLVVKDCALTNGTAERCAGNLDIQYCTATVENVYFANGSASSYAGNINCAGSAPIALTDCVFLDGAAPKGGNIYTPTTNTDMVVTDCLVYNGIATSTGGGNVYAGNGRITILGGEYAFGEAVSVGGNIYALAGNTNADNYLRIGASEKGAPKLYGGSAANGGNLSVKGICYLDAADMRNGTATALGQDLYLDAKGTNQLFTLGSDLEGSFSMGVNAKSLGSPVYGNPIANTACQSLKAEITLEGDYGKPGLSAVDGALYVASLGVEDQEGLVTWYQDTAAAVAACGENDILRLFADRELTLTRDIHLDLNGFAAKVSGAYTVYGMDSTGDEFAVPTGTLQAAAETTVSYDHTAPNGNRYMALNEAGTVTYHRLQLQLTDVVLRPSVSGIYYNGIWGCDEMLRASMDSYGIAVSLESMPGADFATDNHSLWTKLDAAAMESGKKQAGAIIEGILKGDRTDAQNDSYARMSIFATAYLKLNDGTVLLSDAPGYADDVRCSLYDLMKTLDGFLETQPKTYGATTVHARAFYETWKSVMGAWELKKIPTPVDDGVIDVLMIGNSFCHYYVQELYAVAEAAGVKMRVCNLYYGGCPLEKHYTWWLEDSTPYTYYNTDGNGRVGTENVSLEWALSQHEWDVLSIQEVSSTLRNRSAADAFEMNLLYMDTLIPYLMGRFPDADFYWHQTWAYEKGFSVSSYKVLDAAEQKAYAQRQREYALAVCERYDIPRVPSGVAWELVRDGGYDQLCARLGKADGDNPHAGDYYHDGDIGGGQLLNAYVWFEMITGLSCEGNTYVPTYTYSGTTYGLLDGITIQQLQAAAHQAVAEYRAEQE